MPNESLAIEGGPPALTIEPIQWPTASEQIKSNVNAALADGSWGQYEGRWTDELILKLKTEFLSEHAMLCSSGTIAVELALRAVGVQADDEVIIAGYDFPGNFRAIEAIGARPVLVDVIQDGWVIDSELIADALGEKSAAIIVSHLHGQVANLSAIRDVIDQHNIKAERKIAIVEDACQVPGGSISQKPLGSLGDIAALSFGGSKLLSAGRGGAILTNHPEFHQRAKIFANRGNDAFPLSQLQAAVLIPQFESLPESTQKRIRTAEILIAGTKKHDALQSLTQIVPDTNTAYYKLPWLLRDRTPGWSRADFIHALATEGIPIGDGFRGFLRRSPRRCRKIGTLVNSQIASQQTVLLNHAILLQPESIIEKILTAFEKVVNNPR
ncbi:MAG: DegT/DnrJ/EryC1/StrS family aminotransferase [Mariniblastus sp.]|nr:DegT/DnrJ/EryC1/StrS family aminotransferase [Mariniblastus sp.]